MAPSLSATKLVLNLAFLFLADLSLKRCVFSPLSNILIGKDEVKKKAKFVTSCWKLFSYSVMVGLALMVAMDQQDWFWDPSSYHKPYEPLGTVPNGVSRLYHLEIALYAYSIGKMFHEPGMKDFWAMLIHHLVTLTLLISSWRLETTKYGAVIMLLHDAADPLMELAKCSLYAGYEGIANLSFLLFAGTFIYLRDYVYPRHIIWNTYLQLTANRVAFRLPTIACLVALWALHMFWSVLIVKIAINSLKAGEQKGDIREDD